MRGKAIGVLALSAGLLAADDRAGFFRAICPVTKRSAQRDNVLELEDGRFAYFESENPLERYRDNPEKYSAWLNYQFVQTRQAKQVACPLTGRPTKAEHDLQVGPANVMVRFCCKQCREKAAEMDPKE